MSAHKVRAEPIRVEKSVPHAGWIEVGEGFGWRGCQRLVGGAEPCGVALGTKIPEEDRPVVRDGGVGRTGG